MPERWLVYLSSSSDGMHHTIKVAIRGEVYSYFGDRRMVEGFKRRYPRNQHQALDWLKRISYAVEKETR